ncbi:MAG: cadherin repeat domain-containing protein [Bacteroidales bacterium]|nr:cadherin repeat domain-containing protein [Bacteroidales bacterium]
MKIKLSILAFLMSIILIVTYSCKEDDLTNEQPIDIILSDSTVNENELENTIIGAFSTIDADDDIHTYSLVSGNGDDDNNSFIISNNQLQTNAIFDFETQSSYSIRIRTTDQVGNFYEKIFTIYVIDIAEYENIAGKYLLEFKYSFNEGGMSGNTEGTITPVFINQTGNEIEVRNNPGTIDEENNVTFSGHIIDNGTQQFEGTYNKTTKIILGTLSGTAIQSFWNGLFMQSVTVTISKGTCKLTPID